MGQTVSKGKEEYASCYQAGPHDVVGLMSNNVSTENKKERKR